MNVPCSLHAHGQTRSPEYIKKTAFRWIGTPFFPSRKRLWNDGLYNSRRALARTSSDNASDGTVIFVYLAHVG